MPRLLGNGLQTFYGQQSILAPAGQACQILQGVSGNIAQIIGSGGGGAQSIVGTAGIAALTEYSGNGKTYGVSSLAIGQDGAGNSVILARGAQSLSIGANTGGQISIASNGTVSIPAPASGTTLNLTGVAGGNAFVVTGAAASGNSFGIACSAGTTSADRCALFTNQANTQVYALLAGDGSLVMGSATGGTKGLGTINATGIYVNGVAVGGSSNSLTSVGAAHASGVNTTRSTTSQSLDSSLQVTVPSTGTYRVDIFAECTGSVGTAGFILGMSAGGTATQSNFSADVAVVNSSFAVIESFQDSASGSTLTFSSVPTAGGFVRITGTVVITGAGTWGLNWSTASAGTTTLGRGNIVLTKVI